jgi:hypothetical protein
MLKGIFRIFNRNSPETEVLGLDGVSPYRILAAAGSRAGAHLNWSRFFQPRMLLAKDPKSNCLRHERE